MRTTLTSLVTAIAFFAMLGAANAAKISGELVEIDEDYYIIVDQEGNEHEVHFDRTTKKEGDLKPGEQVEVEEEKGHAKSIKAVKLKKQ